MLTMSCLTNTTKTVTFQWKPLPLDTPCTSTNSPSTNIVTSIRSPNFCSVAKFWNSTTFLSYSSAFLKWPKAAFVECFSFCHRNSCNASYPSTPMVLTWVTTHGPASITVQNILPVFIENTSHADFSTN
jgi:hypothetical protein